MTGLRTALLLALVCALIAINASADDLGLIRINSEEQVWSAERILGHAYAKLDDKFLVLVSAEERGQIEAAGMSFELVKPQADISSLFMVLPRNRKAIEAGASTVGAVITTSGDVSLVGSTPSAAAAVTENRDYFVIPLADRTIYFHYSAPSHAAAIAPDETYPVDTLAGLVRKDSIYAYNTHLEAYQTRYIWTPQIDEARDWLASKFQQYGYTDVTTPDFYWGGGTHQNVKAVKPGYAEPEKVIVIGGHFDSWNGQNDPYVFAPGSDDDGSGTSLTLEVARVLKDIPLRKTVIFMPFSAEEVGLVGSNAAATAFRASGTQIEAMFNYDMVGFVTDDIWDLDLSSGSNTAYRDLTAATANRVTSLIPRIVSMGSSSDHYSFHQQGYPVVDNIETDFNYLGWHTNLDLTSRMNFDYLTEVVKLAVTTVAIVANSASPTTITRIEDVGNGSDLEVFWTDCDPQYSYKLYYGTTATTLTDSITIVPGGCSQLVTGLAAGTTYYFAVYGTPSDGYRAISAPISTEKPLLAPRAPRQPSAQPGDHQIEIAWQSPIEQDLAYFNIYRKLSTEEDFGLWKSNLTDTFFVDTAVAGSVRYDYYVTAVDQTVLESAASSVVSSYPATFDGGILIVDEWTQDYPNFPDQNEQEAYWDTVFGGTPFLVDTIETGNAALQKGDAGRFSSIFWMDDDIFNKILKNSTGTIEWYTTYLTNVFIAGYRTVQNWSVTPVASDHVLNEEFKVSSYNYSNLVGFVGATGQNGWPSVQLPPTIPNRGFARITETPIFTPSAGATVIYRFDAHNDDPAFEGQPCGLAYDSPNGKRVILSFPIYYLTPASAESLLTAVKQYFGETAAIGGPGDINGSGFVDLADLSMLIAYLTIPHVPVPNLNGGDVNGSCNIDLSDLARMISYMTTGGPSLLPGCVQP